MQKDYKAFIQALEILQRRLIESNEVDPPRFPLLHQWSGSRAVVGSLELSIHAIRRTIDEYDGFIRKVESGEIPNSDRPTLTLLDGGK